MTVEPGVTNSITRAVAEHGLYFAPDPSSQTMCTIGGNIAENSGGAHCMKYGFTTNHMHAMTMVLPDASVVTVGGSGVEVVGPDLRGAVIGSEGTLGIATSITVRGCVDPRRSAPWSRTSQRLRPPERQSAASSPRGSFPPRSRCSTHWPSRPARRPCTPAIPALRQRQHTGLRERRLLPLVHPGSADE